MSSNSTEKQNMTKEWLETVGQATAQRHVYEDSDDDVYSDDTSSEIVESSSEDEEGEYSAMHSSTDLSDFGETMTTMSLGTQMDASDITSSISEELKNVLNAMNTINTAQTAGNVNIVNSSNVHIGPVTNINGNIQIFQTRRPTKFKSRNHSSSSRSSLSKSDIDKNMPSGSSKEAKNQNANMECVEETNSSDNFMLPIKKKIPKRVLSIIPRRSWLAQKPLEPYDYITEPVEYVVISHTASEDSEKQAGNMCIIRDTQVLHIEGRGWNDIAYNFMIGCDGNIYEGRGWGVRGAHCLGYNECSIGISFVGCFMRSLPSTAALNVCHNLLTKGVEEGHISVNYKLICHSQARPTESPGRKLFEEIQKWPHWYNCEDDDGDDHNTVDDSSEILSLATNTTGSTSVS